MSAPSVPAEVENALSLLETAMDALATVSLTSATDDCVLAAWQRLEIARRRLDPVEHRVITEIEQRTLAEKHACRNTAGLARQLLRLHPSEAAARVKAAQALGPRRATTGEPLEPTYPKVAAALAGGAISSRHARVITGMLEDLPEPVRAMHGEEAEQQLTIAARSFDPKELGKLACRIAYVLDQDGRYRDADERDRKRQLNLRRRPDGPGGSRAS